MNKLKIFSITLTLPAFIGSFLFEFGYKIYDVISTATSSLFGPLSLIFTIIGFILFFIYIGKFFVAREKDASVIFGKLFLIYMIITVFVFVRGFANPNMGDITETQNNTFKTFESQDFQPDNIKTTTNFSRWLPISKVSVLVESGVSVYYYSVSSNKSDGPFVNFKEEKYSDYLNSKVYIKNEITKNCTDSELSIKQEHGEYNSLSMSDKDGLKQLQFNPEVKNYFAVNSYKKDGVDIFECNANGLLGGVISTVTLYFDDSGIVTTLYFLNQKNNFYKDMSTFAKEKSLFINEYIAYSKLSNI